MIGPAIILVLLLAACDARPGKPSADTAQAAINAVVYVKDPRTGYCFAVMQSAVIANPNGASISITWVPCDAINEKVLGQKP